MAQLVTSTPLSCGGCRVGRGKKQIFEALKAGQLLPTGQTFQSPGVKAVLTRAQSCSLTMAEASATASRRQEWWKELKARLGGTVQHEKKSKPCTMTSSSNNKEEAEVPLMHWLSARDELVRNL